MFKKMTLKTEPMEMEGNEDMFRMRSFTRSIIPKSFDLTDDQKAMRLPSPDEPFITGIFHRNSEQMSNQSFNMLRSDVSAMQQAHYFGGERVKTSPTPAEREHKDEEYPTYTIARSEMELNSRLLPKKYKCKFCVYKTSYKSDLNRHLRRHAKKDNIYNCDVCNLPFRSISKVYSHRQQCHGESNIVKEESPLACTMCNFKCAEKDIELFQLHIQKHIEENTCDICNKSFNSKGAVDKHIKIYHQVTNEVVFPSQPIRSVDMSYIPEASRNATFSGMNNSMLDMDSDHSPAGGSSASNSCDGSTNSTPIPFNHYTKGMNIRSILQKRERQNGDDRSKIKDVNRSPTKSSNDFSDKSAQQSKNLYDLKNPKKERENISEISAENGNEFKSSFKCGKCASIFLDVRDLFIHMSVCLQEEVSVKIANFNCPICSFTSEELELFTSHMLRHTVDKFSCDICNRPFTNFRNVLSHKRKVHKVDVRCKRSPTKMKFIGLNKSSPKSLSAKSNNPPYSKETIGNVSKMAEEESKKENMETDTELNQTRPSVETQTSSQGQLTLGSTSNAVKDTLTSGRYAKLISDFDDFTLKPFACSLCFYRTEKLIDLKSHVENHIAGSVNEGHPNFVKLNFESDLDSNIKTKDYVYNIAMSADPNSNQNSVNFTLNDSIDATSVIYPKESQNYTKQIRYLENLLKKTRSKSKSIFLSRTRKHQALPNTRSFPCKICKKEFSMHILAKRHLIKIHNVKN